MHIIKIGPNQRSKAESRFFQPESNHRRFRETADGSQCHLRCLLKRSNVWSSSLSNVDKVNVRDTFSFPDWSFERDGHVFFTQRQCPSLKRIIGNEIENEKGKQRCGCRSVSHNLYCTVHMCIHGYTHSFCPGTNWTWAIVGDSMAPEPDRCTLPTWRAVEELSECDTWWPCFGYSEQLQLRRYTRQALVSRKRDARRLDMRSRHLHFMGIMSWGTTGSILLDPPRARRSSMPLVDRKTYGCSSCACRNDD